MKRLLFSCLLTLTALSGTWAQGADTTDLDAKYATSLIQAGQPVPDMVVDTARNIRLSDYRGAYVVLHFWASWCPDCRKDMPQMIKLSEKYDGPAIYFIHISYDTNKQTLQKYMAENPMKGLLICSLQKFKETETSRLFHINWIPSMYLIGPDGKVQLATVEINKLQTALENIDLHKSGFPSEKIFTMPSWPEGVNGLVKFLCNSMRYPKLPLKYGAMGRTIVKFVVDANGNIVNPEIKSNEITKIADKRFWQQPSDKQPALYKQFLDDFAQEALRVVCTMKAWSPGTRYGKPFNTTYNLPVSFKL